MLIYRLVEVKRHLVGGVGESGWYNVESSDEASGEAQHADPRGGGGTRFPKFSKFHTWFGSAPPARTRTATARRACATCAANHGHMPGRQRGPARLSNKYTAPIPHFEVKRELDLLKSSINGQVREASQIANLMLIIPISRGELRVRFAYWRLDAYCVCLSVLG